MLKCTDIKTNQRNIVHEEPLRVLTGEETRTLQVKSGKKKMDIVLDKWTVRDYVRGEITSDFFRPRDYCLLFWTKDLQAKHLQTIWNNTQRLLILIRL